MKWRGAGIPSYIHIDDGLGFRMTREEARVSAKRVMEDISRLGLVVSEEKCCMGALPAVPVVWVQLGPEGVHHLCA